jgi:hypothetical protein
MKPVSVIFGREAAVELPPRQSFPFEAINSRVARDGSNLAKGLGLAAAMLPEANQGRVVLISDGNETDGAAAAQLNELKARGIPVDVLPISYGYDKEVWLERLDLPRIVKAGETYEASVVLNSLAAGAGKMTLQENGKTIFEKEVEFTCGQESLHAAALSARARLLRIPRTHRTARRVRMAGPRTMWRSATCI